MLGGLSSALHCEDGLLVFRGEAVFKSSKRCHPRPVLGYQWAGQTKV